MTNPATYSRPDVTQHYGSLIGLFDAEERLIEPMREDLEKGRVLDLGIGGGRTTGTLSYWAKEYVGIDYSPEMVEVARERHPGLDLRVADVRDLSEFEDESFTHVFFLFNGLDYINHEDRLKALAEIKRVLTPTGTFLFTSHNRDFKRVNKAPWQVDYRLTEKVSRSIDYIKHRQTRRAMAALTQETREYALVNDDAHGYSLLTYYIDPVSQISQLFRAGFNPGPVYSQKGTQLDFGRENCWYYYLCWNL